MVMSGFRNRPLCLLFLLAAVAVPACHRKNASPYVSLVYEIKIGDVPEAKRVGIAERIANVIRKRLDPDGIRELTVRPAGEYGIEIQIAVKPGTDDQEIAALAADAKRKVGQVGRLEFRLLPEEAVEREARASGNLPSGSKWLPVAKAAQAGLNGRENILIRLDDGFDITGADLDSVGKSTDERGQPAVSFTFNNVGAKRFGRLTSQNIDKSLAIILDGQVMSAPVIRSRIDKHGEITGGANGFTPQEQDDLVAILNAGSLDAPLILQSERVVGTPMGDAARKARRQFESSGGTVIGFTTKSPMTVDDVQRRLAAAGYPQVAIQQVRRPSEAALGPGLSRGFLVTVVGDLDAERVLDRVYAALATELPPREIQYTLNATPIPLDVREDTGDRKTFAGGLDSEVTLDPSISRAEIEERLTSAVEWSKNTGNFFGEYLVVVPAAAAKGPVAKFHLYSEDDDPAIVEAVLNRAFVTSPYTITLMSVEPGRR